MGGITPPPAWGVAVPFLHIVVVRGGNPWLLGALLWLLPGVLALLFAALTGEVDRADAFAFDLALAFAGGVALDAAFVPFGTDPVAYFFGVRVFWTLLGALLILVLAHDAVRLLSPEQRRCLPIGARGGALFLYTWVSGWPSEPGLLSVSYGDGLALKLTPGVLHYQVRRGPLIGARAVALRGGATARSDGGTLVLRAAPGTPEIRLYQVRPADLLPALLRAIGEQTAHPPEPIAAEPFRPL